MEALRGTSYPARFQIREVAGRRVLVPEAVQDGNGAWVSTNPLLDTRIEVPTGSRPCETALGQWIAAIEAATGERIIIGQFVRGSTDGGGVGSARDVLVSILDGDHPSDPTIGQNTVWLLVWYEEGQHWILNLGRVWALEPPDGPPPPTPVPAEPPRR